MNLDKSKNVGSLLDVISDEDGMVNHTDLKVFKYLKSNLKLVTYKDQMYRAYAKDGYYFKNTGTSEVSSRTGSELMERIRTVVKDNK